MTQNATQAKKSRSFTVGVSFRLSSYYSLALTNQQQTHTGGNHDISLPDCYEFFYSNIKTHL